MMKDNADFIKYDDNEIRKAFEFQVSNNLWNFYNEREFLENLLSQRFNYLILVYSLFISAAAVMYSNGSEYLLLIIFLIGTIVTRLTCITIYRVYGKMMINLEILDKLGDLHVFPFIRIETKARKIKCENANKIIGIVILP